MSKKNISTVVRDGFLYSIHQTSINNGQKRIKDIFALKPRSIKDLQLAIDSNIITELHAMDLLNAKLAIELQQQARQATKSNKMPKADYDRIYNDMDVEYKKVWAIADAKVHEIYQLEQDDIYQDEDEPTTTIEDIVDGEDT